MPARQPPPLMSSLAALALAGRDRVRVGVAVRDAAVPVVGAIVAAISPDGARHAAGRVADDGRLAFDLPRGAGSWKLESTRRNAHRRLTRGR